MKESDVKALLGKSFVKLSEPLRDAVIDQVLKDTDYSLTDWEQFRGIKKELDLIWKEVKNCSECVVVPHRAEALKVALDGLRSK
jgi:hypothetical protein